MLLDRPFTDDAGFRKPRHGLCHLCGAPCLEHPAWKHRLFVVWAIAARFTASR